LQAALAWLGCFLSVLLVGGIFGWVDQQWSLPLMLASFGPTAALLYGSPKLPAAQPWNAMGEGSQVMLHMLINRTLQYLMLHMSPTSKTVIGLHSQNMCRFQLVKLCCDCVPHYK